MEFNETIEQELIENMLAVGIIWQHGEFMEAGGALLAPEIKQMSFKTFLKNYINLSGDDKTKLFKAAIVKANELLEQEPEQKEE